MNQDKINYILSYHSNFMTPQEKLAWRHWSSAYKLEKSNSSDEQKEAKRKVYLHKRWMTKDKRILKLLENGIEEFERKTAIRIDLENEIEYNNCPKCERLTRTPQAKQCRFCGYDWH